MSRKSDIVSSFSRSLSTYDANANLQARVSARLATKLPGAERPDVLELGCGTGLFTKAILARYPHGRFFISDVSKRAVRECEARIGRKSGRSFAVIDGDSPSFDRQFDVIASSMALHWFDDPVKSLCVQRAALKPGGRVVYAAIGPDNFSEWSATLDELGLANGIVRMPELQGVSNEERLSVDYGSAYKFLKSLKNTGAAIARAGHTSLGPGEVRRACRRFDERFSGTVTWHITYGMLESEYGDHEETVRKKSAVVG